MQVVEVDGGLEHTGGVGATSGRVGQDSRQVPGGRVLDEPSREGGGQRLLGGVLERVSGGEVAGVLVADDEGGQRGRLVEGGADGAGGGVLGPVRLRKPARTSCAGRGGSGSWSLLASRSCSVVVFQGASPRARVEATYRASRVISGVMRACAVSTVKPWDRWAVAA